jgi:ankyrin repeat protein
VAKDSIKEVALCVAIAMQRRDIIDALITDSASVWHKTYTFRMPIQLAAQMQDIDMVKLVLGYMGKMDNGVTMKERVKVLSKAITEYAKMRLPFYTDEEDESEKKEITALLIRWHIENLSKPSMDARTTFFEWCLDHADTSLLEVLLSIPTDKKVKDRYRWTYFQNVPSAAITKVLINKGIFDVTGVYNDLPRPPSPRRFWCTALDVVLGSVTVLNHAVYFGNEETVQMVLEMLDSGDRTNMSSALKGTLQLATSESNPTSETMLNIVAMLLKKGADPTAEDATHALANAAKQNDEEMVKLLLDHGADPRESWALYEAVKWQSVYMVKLLLKHGAKADGEPWPIHEAIKSKNQAIVADLLKFGANPNGEGWALAQAVQMNHRKFATMLLKAGADPNGDRWPLRCAIDESNFEMVKLLLEHGADPESGSDGDNDCTLALTYPRDNRNPIWLALVGAIKNKMDILGKDYQLIENAYAYYRWAPYEIFSRMSGTAMPREGYDGLIALDTASRSASPQSSVESESGPRRRGGSSERSRVRKRADYEADDDIDSIMLGIPREIRRVRRRRH